MKLNSEKDLEGQVDYYANLPYKVIVEQWDDGNGPYWVARVVELPHCLIHGDSPEEAIRELEEVKKDWIKSNLKRGINIPQPITNKYSGQIRLRITPSLHQLLAHRSLVEGVSLNQYMNATLARAVGSDYEWSEDTMRRDEIKREIKV